MNLKRTWAVASKEWQEIRRDRLFIALAFIVPVSITVLYAYSLALDVEQIPMSIVDYDRTNMSREYAERFIHSRYFEFKGYLDDRHQIDGLLTQGKVRAVLVIPEHFQEDLGAGKLAHVQALIDGSTPMSSQMVKGYVIAINGAESKRLAAEYVSKTGGIPRARAEATILPFKLETRYLYNQASRSIWTIAPTLMMLVLMIIPPFYTTLGVVREKESGAIYNIYASTLTRFEFLIGKLAPYVFISILNSVILFVLATQLFGAPFKGTFLFFVPATIVYVICTTSVGLMVSVLVRTQIAAELITGVVTIFPTFAYAGLFKPVASLKESDQIIAHFLPGMYYTNIVHGSFLKGLGWRELGWNVAVLAIYATVLLTVSMLVFRKRPNQ